MTSINAKEFLITTVLVSAFVGVSYGIDCYYCEPTDNGCDDPIEGNRPVINCQSITGHDNPMARVLEEQRSRLNSSEYPTYQCAALKVNNKDNKNMTGMYRTCVVNITTGDQCNALKAEFKDEGYGQVESCKLCNETSCNSWTMEGFKNSSPESFTSVLLYTFLSCIFVAYVI